MITNLYWCICKVPNNMGDMIAPYLFNKITGYNAKNGALTTGPFFLSCGSIITKCSKNAIVWGTGTMFNNGKIHAPIKILSVRGPLTRQVFLNNRISCPEIYGDPGLLLPRYYTPILNDRKYKVGIIPHYVDHKYMTKLFSNIPNILVIDICRSVEKVCDDIVACDATISSSLHGIIVSHAYNVPSAWMTASQYATKPIGGGAVKYNDYYLSRNVQQIKPILWNKLSKDPEILYNQILDYPQPNNTIDLDKLVQSCPFGKTYQEILVS